MPTQIDVVVIGGGQAGLATAYFLRRAGIDYVVLDDQSAAGGAWRHTWDSLHLFSPAPWSSLPGWQMPISQQEYPSRNEVIDYLARYEDRYQIPVLRPVHVQSVSPAQDGLLVATDRGQWLAKAVVSATGTWSAPYTPDYPGREIFRGRQIHSAQYRCSDELHGQDVLVVGGGNSGAQILAEVSKVCRATWVTLHEPVFLPDDVDGQVLFERATARWKALREGVTPPVPVGGLGDIVMVPPVREARERGVLISRRPFSDFDADGVVWGDGSSSHVDVVIWCTGFRPALSHLGPLQLSIVDGAPRTDGTTRSRDEARLWLVGYGEWCGAASATLIGVMRGARDAAQGIVQFLETTRAAAAPVSRRAGDEAPQ
ncbi:FAD-dependent oxidoreductase [Paraburkholderia sp. NMBU_R16]|uniref:ArsO family NAD(P)H-dependent flavin-containing monooxygenase n=1 Tax=Paraburkholderia sp. NMBU_R16 TaxID=2698676 RepID=UPI001564FFB4|nr:ArsO family NAD(P)H-dependent flavin-containing monooxygenase [Paraburkholderia sp. NMBU_R16]NRO99206.1 FAD-dependent oxidoreductase [Paraburkholderia sp. NMBU_R16]